MRLENEHTHYRARFEIFPYDNTDEVGPFVMQVLCNWLREKEYGRHRYGEMSRIYEMLESGTINYHEAYPEKVSRGCYFAKQLLDGVSVPFDYDGGAVRNGDSKICTRSFSEDASDGFPQYWAMDFDEPDGRFRYRRWHTSVGMTCMGNTCVANVRITNYLTPGFVGNQPEQPHSTTPNFVKGLISLRGCQTCVGETVLHDSPIGIGADNFQSDFVDNLLSNDRELPMIVVVPTITGDMPIKVDDLALKVLGIANVYTMDYGSRELKESLNNLFRFGEPSGKFHLGAGWVRIYEPRVNLRSESNSRLHRFFRVEDIEEYGDTFNDMLTRSLTRSWFQDDSDIIDVIDVDTQARRAKNEELRRRLDSLGKRSGDRTADNGLAIERANEDQASHMELKAMLAKQDAIIADLRDEASEWEEIATSYAVQVESMTATEKGERKKTQAQIAGYEEQILQLEGEKDSLDNANRKLQYKADDAQKRCEQADEELKTTKEALDEYERITHIPTKLSEALALVSSIYSSRIVVLEEARKSAEAFDGQYRLDDEWLILRSVPTVLWDIYFGKKTCSDIPEAYYSRAGFELALNEGSQTNKDLQLLKSRERLYRGQTIRVIPHIKGKDSSPKNAFRLHYYVDNKRKKIVIGHCGAHLNTAGTRKNA